MNTFRLFLLSPVGEILLHWTLLLAFAWMASAAMCRSHPRRRLILWRSVLVLCCLLPFASIVPKRVFQIDVKPTLTESVTPTGASAASAVDIRQSTFVHAAPMALRLIEDYITANFAVTLIALIWMIGVGVGALRLFLLQRRLSHLRRTAREPDTGLLAQAREVQSRLGIRQTATVRVSDEVNSPFVTGLLHPTIILPAKWQRSLEAIQIEVLLSHEVAHLRSHDLAWCIGWRWMKVFGWFHPLIWKAPSAHYLACQQEADRIASGRWTDRGLYTRSLAQLTLRVMKLPAVEATLAMNGTSQIVKRLTFLRRGGFGRWRWRDSLAGIGLVVGLALLTMGWGLSNARAESPASGRTEGRIKRTTPDPAREPPLRRFIQGVVNGKPDLADLGPSLTVAVKEQWARAQKEFAGSGPLKSLVFEKVNDRGWDVYIATFEHKKWEYLIGPLNAEHKMEGLVSRPVPNAATLERIKNNTPDPAREPLLRRNIAGLVSGHPDIADMAPDLIAATQKQWPAIQQAFAGTGALKSLVFEKVNDRGWDSYMATFEHKKWEFLIGPLNAKHKMQGLLMRPVPNAATLERIKNNTPDPAREPPLRRYIVGLVSGHPDIADMAPGLIAATRKQWPAIQKAFAGLGALKSLVLKNVNDRGWDVYIATFEHRKIRFLIGPLNADHKMVGLLMRPAS